MASWTQWQATRGDDVSVNLPAWLDWLPLVRGQHEAPPPRVLPLPLELPPLRTRGRFSRGKGLPMPPLERWSQLVEHPIELLREIDHYLIQLNVEPLPEGRRLQGVSHCLQHACPAIRKIYSEHHKGEALPESHDRREGLKAAIQVCSQLAIGYKHVLRSDYQLPDRRFARVRPRVRECVRLVLELIRVEQRLRALRYLKLPPATWLDCNRIFFAIRQVEDVNTTYKALPCLQVQLERRDGDLNRRAPVTTSLAQSFLAIQLFGLLDTNTIASQKMHIVDAQLSGVLPKLKLMADDGEALSSGEVIVYGNQDRPPFFEREDEKATAALAQQRLVDVAEQGVINEQKVPVALRIDLVPLEVALIKEHERLWQLFESEAEDDRARMAADSLDLERLLTVDAMCDKLHLKRRRSQRKYSLGDKILYVYTGFMPVYQLLVETLAEGDDEAPIGDDNALRDALAERSALISADTDSHGSGQWFVMDISAGGVRIKTRESQFTTGLFIGQLVAFGFTREELRAPRVGYVARLLRNGADIEVTLRLLSSQVVPTAVQSEFLSQSEMALPAVWARLGNGREGLILHQSHRLSPGTRVTLELDGERVSRIIRPAETMQREFVLNLLSAD